jgi:predicted PurR-regulated permease PerM
MPLLYWFMPNKNENYSEFTRKVFIAAGILLLWLIFAAAFIKANYVFLLIFASIVAAVILRGAAAKITEWLKVKIKYSLIIIILFLVSLGTALFFITGPSIAEGYNNLQRELPSSIDTLTSYIEESPLGERFLRSIENSDIFSDDNLPGYIWGAFSTALGATIGLVFVIVISLYLAFDARDYTRNGFIKLFPKNHRKKAVEISNSMGRALKWWVFGQFGSMLTIGLLTYFALMFMGIPMAFTLALLAGICTFVPTLGPVAASIPAMLLAFSISPAKALVVGLVYLGLQNFEGYFLTPMIEKKAVYLPPALLITFQILMFSLLGVFAVILAAPLLVVLMVFIQMYYVEEKLDDDVEVLGDRDKKE